MFEMIIRVIISSEFVFTIRMFCPLVPVSSPVFWPKFPGVLFTNES